MTKIRFFLFLYILINVSFISKLFAFSPKDLQGCYRTLEVNSKKVNFLDNLSMIHSGTSGLYVSNDTSSMKSIIFTLFNQRHFESNTTWDEWNTLDLFLNEGKWNFNQDSKILFFTFSGKLRSIVNFNVIFEYNSNLQVEILEKQLLKIKLSYDYVSNISFSDSWSSTFLIRRVEDSLCL